MIFPQWNTIKKTAEEVRFELTVPCGTPVFKTGALDHYATPPESIQYKCSRMRDILNITGLMGAA